MRRASMGENAPSPSPPQSDEPDKRIVRRAPTDNLQLSASGLRCENLMHKCIDGDYAALPEFATTVWEWFAEAPRAADPRVTAHNVGHKAAFLLFSMNAKFDQAKALGAPKKAPTDGVIDVVLAFLSGCFLWHEYAWAVCVAWMSMRLLSAARLFDTVRSASPLPEGMVFAHAYFTMSQDAAASLFHAVAWHVVWRC